MTAALTRLDAFLVREILRLRARYQLTMDEFRGLYISDEQVDSLLARSNAVSAAPRALPAQKPDPALAAVIARFTLNEVAADLLILALAPDIHPKYATLIAYLNDDVRRRWPTIDLARRLFGAETATALDPDGPLFGPGLLLAAPSTEPRLALPLQEFCPNPVLSAYLLGRAGAAAQGFSSEPPVVAKSVDELAWLARVLGAGGHLLVVLSGTGADRVGAIRSLGRPIVRLSLSGEGATTLLRDASLAARLEEAVLVLEPDDAYLRTLAPALPRLPVPIFLLTPPGDAWRPALAGCAGVRIELPPPDHLQRRAFWQAALGRAGLLCTDAAMTEVADRFRISARQIEAAAASLPLAQDANATCTTAALIAAARAQAGADLAHLAQRVITQHGWQDLVLHHTCQRQVQRFAAAIRYRDRVFAEWGLSGGPGLTALFAGGPGTGKTMSAGVLAREAGLDLWRIDFSAVVSKYIGETEKQLDRIFAQARDGNAILFFDEADAMFGKRSEVKDAHDRYANIEVAYLLQRLESYDGVVILATNLARNIDPAFGRRLHFVIDFPLPDACLREQLWRAALPARAPRAPDLDLAFVARQFAFAGGDIRVAALDAAFTAAADDAPIDMVRLLQAVGRQLLKQGKVPQGSDFGAYRTLVAEVGASLRPVVAQ